MIADATLASALTGDGDVNQLCPAFLALPVGWSGDSDIVSAAVPRRSVISYFASFYVYSYFSKVGITLKIPKIDEKTPHQYFHKF